MQNVRSSAILAIDGYEISATFAEHRNTEAIGHVKQILLSSFASNVPKKKYPGDILVMPPEQSYNDNGGRHHVP